MSRCICHPAHRCGACDDAKLCALCTDPIIGSAVREPFGRNGGLVDVCQDCSSVHPRSGRYGFNGGRDVGTVDHVQHNGKGHKTGRVPARGTK
jgi:hypothetical protein